MFNKILEKIYIKKSKMSFDYKNVQTIIFKNFKNYVSAMHRLISTDL